MSMHVASAYQVSGREQSVEWIGVERRLTLSEDPRTSWIHHEADAQTFPQVRLAAWHAGPHR